MTLLQTKVMLKQMEVTEQLNGCTPLVSNDHKQFDFALGEMVRDDGALVLGWRFQCVGCGLEVFPHEGIMMGNATMFECNPMFGYEARVAMRAHWLSGLSLESDEIPGRKAFNAAKKEIDREDLGAGR